MKFSRKLYVTFMVSAGIALFMLPSLVNAITAACAMCGGTVHVACVMCDQ